MSSMQVHMGTFSVLLMLSAPGALASQNGSAANGSAVCVHECDRCKTFESWCGAPWYFQENGTCTKRTPKVADFYAIGLNCHINKDPIRDIRDEQSCWKALSHSQHHVLLGDVHLSFNASDGCRVNAENFGFLGLRRVESDVCFGQVNKTAALVSQLVALALGLLLGALSMWYERKHIHAFRGRHIGKEVKFMAGAKQIAMHSCVGACKMHYIMFYRFNQVIANVWFPMALMWIASPLIVIPLWLLLYWVPAFAKVGSAVFSQPRYVVTPPLCSLLGIGNEHHSPPFYFAFSMLRPAIMIAAVMSIGRIIVFFGRTNGLTDEEIGPWVVNSVSMWGVGMEHYWGSIAHHFTMIVTVVGTFLHILTTIPPVVKALRNKDHGEDEIRLVRDPPFHETMQALTDKICAAAVKDDEDDQDRVGDLTGPDGEPIAIMGLRDVIVAFALAIIDFCAYLFKIYTFLSQGRYFLAAVMTIALTESLTTVVMGGHLQKAHRAFVEVAKTGVPTEHFLACCQWDDGLAGIPCLWMTVYGLPLLDIDSARVSLTSIFFLLSGTRALAMYVRDVTDGAMFHDQELALAGAKGESRAELLAGDNEAEPAE